MKYLDRIRIKSIALVILCILLMGCNNINSEKINGKQENKKSSQNTNQKVDGTDESESNTVSNQDKEKVDDNSLETVLSNINNIKDIPENTHNIFEGFIGRERIIMDIYVDSEGVTLYYVGKDKTKEYKLVGSILNDNIIVKDNDNTTLMILNNAQNGEIYGEYYADGPKTNIRVRFSYITGEGNLDNRYTLGEDDTKTERFVQEIIDAITNKSLKDFMTYIAYPLKVRGNRNMEIINLEQFKKNKVLNKRLRNTITNSFSKFMYSSEEGIRIGDSKYNIWIKLNDDGEWIITEINN
ncbi:hypothetical protein [Anaeromicropila herbilytica]|uniref:Lipoprotein n=1 Tax=Anaeromicropila herbilytica TaxID=2785025 RepID=A0A7R7EPU6_9FIRM|nr:hypothetical protein [Anaeromicropila herbilytica]BCN32772.1 hypothetical protein bsdtb5_40670 [Anaeromicropila herbilytica]